jgi:hypothetical protein
VCAVNQQAPAAWAPNVRAAWCPGRLDRQRAAGRGAVEGGHQLRRRDRLHHADLLILPILNIYRKYYGARMAVFLLPAASLLVRFWRTGGPTMLKMMGGSPDHSEHEHADTRMHNGHHD